jgi:hypothetical protein
MAVRNFYVSGTVDGRRTDIGAGPQAKDGGMSLHITQRNEGAIVTALHIECSEYGGQLTTRAWNGNGDKVFEYCTKR